MNRNIFGREPAAVVAVIQSFLALALGFGWLSPIGLSTQEDLAIVMGVVGAAAAVFLAWGTTETLLAPVIELLKAGIALSAIYGLNISVEETALLVAAVTAAFGLFQRTQVSPAFAPATPGPVPA